MMELTTDLKREMFWTMLLARRLDERAWLLHRQGKIAFHISGIGHEAAQVGAVFALRRGFDWVVPYYRDLALLLGLGYTPRDFMLALMGKRGERTSGARQMPSHWSFKAMNVVSHSSPVATQALHAAGIGLAIKRRGEERIVFTSTGEGSTSEGEWYEAVNWAAVHRLPVVFNVQNNQYAISEPASRQMAVSGAAERACGMGLKGVSVDGMDAPACHRAFLEVFDHVRSGAGPAVIETCVYRITPHSSDDDDRSYRSREEVEHYKQNDCLPRAEKALGLEPELVEELERKAKAMVDDAVAFALSAPDPDGPEAAYPVYAEDVRDA